MLKENKKYLHLTSTNFDEPEGVKICNNSDMVLAIHGAEENDDFYMTETDNFVELSR